MTATMDPTTWVLEHADRIGAFLLLILAVLALVTGKVVPGKTHDRVVKERDLYLEMATRGMELARRTTELELEKRKT